MSNKLSKDPTQFAGGYTLDLYCDHWSGPIAGAERLDTPDGYHSWTEFPHTFIGETWGQCAQAARRRGWVIHRNTRTATCPKCSGK